MEEVDKIIIHTLREIGCDLDEEITNIKQFDSDMIVNAAVRCLDIICPGLNLPHSLPPNMAAKYRLGQQIAQACIDVGYKADIGYQTFLYSGEADIRKILMFLVEKLPKEEEKFVREPSGSELLMNRIKCKVKEEILRPWLPCDLQTERISCKFESKTDIDLPPNQAWRQFWREDLPFETIDNKHLLPTVITLHSRGVLAKYEPHWFMLKKPLQAPKPATELNKYSTDAIVNKRKPALPPKPKPLAQNYSEGLKEKQTDQLVEEEKIVSDVEDLQNQIKELKLKRQQIQQKSNQQEKELQTERAKNALEARVLELMPNATMNIEKLQKVLEERTQKLVHLARQWEQHRQPLVLQYRHAVSARSSKQSETVKKAETTRTLAEKRRELEAELKGKQQLLTQLQTEAERVGKEAHRCAYIRRILEIIGNVEKQKLEIAKVLKDTQEVQKEINTLNGQLDRCFTITDETIFQDAKRDETSRKAYKLLATLHADCDHLVAMVQETGAILRETRDLEDQIEKERSKDVAGNLARITADLKQMQQESEALSTQLKLQQSEPS